MKYLYFSLLSFSLAACTHTAFTPPADDLQKMVYCFIDRSAEEGKEHHPYKQCETPTQIDDRANIYTARAWDCIQKTAEEAEKAFAEGRDYTAPNGQVMIESEYGPAFYCGIKAGVGNGVIDMNLLHFKTIKADDSQGIVEVKDDGSMIAGDGIRYFLIKEDTRWKIDKSEFLDDPFVQ